MRKLGAYSALAPGLSLETRISHFLERTLGRSYSGFFLSICEYTEQEPTAGVKTYFPSSLASTQPFSPTNRQIVIERLESQAVPK